MLPKAVTSPQERGDKKMRKAKYIGKYYGTGYDSNSVYFEYEYRGMKYTVYENLSKGNEPLSWQHRTEQERIDFILDAPKATGKSKPFEFNDLDIIFDD